MVGQSSNENGEESAGESPSPRDGDKMRSRRDKDPAAKRSSNEDGEESAGESLSPRDSDKTEKDCEAG